MPNTSKRLHSCIHVSRFFFFLFWWDVALYPTLKQTAVLGCIKSSTSAVTRALRCQLRGRPFHPWAGRLRFSGAATLTQSSSFSCGAGLQSESRLLLCCAPAVYMLGDAAAVAAAVFGLEHLISYCNYTKRSFGPTSRGQGRRLCHAMPNYRPGEVNPKQQLHFCCRSPCESRDCCAAVAVPSGSELPSSLMLIQYFEVHNTSPNKSTASSNSKRSQRRRDDVRGTPTPLADDRAMRRLSDTDDCSC